ncbi:hypothetical protein BKA61DRAFT_732375 [Leptodontidium sp. MPI-SDFR-AT-0119]|nr:hypothetical protein BKA61DRAFT_732375 [Leptodontidium sp. MPI-SDFR-AT-0119]
MPKSKVAEPYDMKEKDIEFLVTCLRNTIGSPLIIDAAKVAKEMNFGNTRSVGNKMSILKKKYGFEKVITITGASKTLPKTHTSQAPNGEVNTAKKTTPSVSTERPVIEEAKVKAEVEADEDERMHDIVIDVNQVMDEALRQLLYRN